MQFTLDLSKATKFTGRNGYHNMKGIHFLLVEDNSVVMIAPITSKGEVGRCDIEVPVEDLDVLIAKLQEIKNSL